MKKREPKKAGAANGMVTGIAVTFGLVVLLCFVCALLMQKIRDALDEGRFTEFRAEYSEKLAQRL